MDQTTGTADRTRRCLRPCIFPTMQVNAMKRLLLTSIAALFLATGAARAETQSEKSERCATASKTGAEYARCVSETITPAEVTRAIEADILAALRKRFPTAETPDWWNGQKVNFFDGQWHRTCNLRLKPKPIKIYRCGIVH